MNADITLRTSNRSTLSDAAASIAIVGSIAVLALLGGLHALSPNSIRPFA